MSSVLVGKENWTQDVHLVEWGRHQEGQCRSICGEGWEYSGSAVSRDLSNRAESTPSEQIAAESWGLLQDPGHGWGMALREGVAVLVRWFHVPA